MCKKEQAGPSWVCAGLHAGVGIWQPAALGCRRLHHHAADPLSTRGRHALPCHAMHLLASRPAESISLADIASGDSASATPASPGNILCNASSFHHLSCDCISAPSSNSSNCQWYRIPPSNTPSEIVQDIQPGARVSTCRGTNRCAHSVQSPKRGNPSGAVWAHYQEGVGYNQVIIPLLTCFERKAHARTLRPTYNVGLPLVWSPRPRAGNQ